MTATTPDVAGVLMCLSCHDGNYATGAMMKNKVYETLPSTYGTQNNIPTLLGNDGTGTGNYLNDHPVGLTAVMGCGGPYDWDCTISATGTVQMNGAEFRAVRHELRLLCQPGGLQQPAHRDVHHLPQPAPDERGQGDHTAPKSGSAAAATTRPCSSFALPTTRPAAPPAATRRRSSAASAMVAKSNEMNGGTAVTTFLDPLCMRGGVEHFPPPFFSNQEVNMKYKFSICGFFLLALAAAGAQVASHAPTVFTQAPSSSRRRSPASAAGKPVARVNGAVLTDADLVREEYAIFPYARQHNGIPKDLAPQIRDGALKMIIFEELVYQEALRRKMTVPAAKMQRAEADFRKQFATPDEFNALLQSEFHGSQQLLQEKIRRSLLIEALLEDRGRETRALSPPAEVRAYYDKNPARFQHPEIVYLPDHLCSSSGQRHRRPVEGRRARAPRTRCARRRRPRRPKSSACWRRRSPTTITA